MNKSSEMDKILIYGLISSETPTLIKYVGKTKQIIKKRLHDHIRESYKFKTKKDIWIQSVINNGFSVNYVIIEECDENNWLDREKYWISELNNLTNISKGGDGGRGLLAIKSYDELKLFVKSNMQNVTNSVDWIKFVECNPKYNFLPKYPYVSYKNRGWCGWKDLLVNYKTNSVNFKRNAFRVIFTYNECKAYLNQFKIIGKRNFKERVKTMDARVPSQPDIYYKNRKEWINWMDFLSYN
jgi:hypothetical protein